MSTMKDALTGAMSNNAELAAAIEKEISRIKTCELGKNVDGKFVPTGTFYMVGMRVCDTLEEAKIIAKKKATKKFFDEQALLAEKEEAAAKVAAEQIAFTAIQEANAKKGRMAKYAAKYNKRK